MPKKLLFFVVVLRSIVALFPLNHWDAPHYLWIAKHGYTSLGDEANFIVFQPLYPLLIRFFPANLVSVVCALLASIVFYKLLKLDFSTKVAATGVILLNIFPTSYFLSSPYTESLFLFLSITSLYLARKHNWFLAGILAGLSVLTRHVGIFLILPLVIEWLTSKNKRLYHPALFVFPVVAAILIYLSINYWVYGDPLAFQKILHDHWFKTFVPFWKSVFHTWEIALGGTDSYNIELGLWEAIPATAALVLIPLMWKILRKSYAAYYTAMVLFITSTSFLLSTPRYLISIPQIFVFLAILSNKSRLFFITWSIISTGLLLFFARLFISGDWAF